MMKKQVNTFDANSFSVHFLWLHLIFPNVLDNNGKIISSCTCVMIKINYIDCIKLTGVDPQAVENKRVTGW